MVSKYFSLLLGLILSMSVLAHAESSLIVIPKKASARPLSLPYLSLPLFTTNEQQTLTQFKRSKLARTRIYPQLSDADLKKLMSLIQRSYSEDYDTEISTTASIQEDPLAPLQWALNNNGTIQKISIDHYTSGRIISRPGEDVRIPSPINADKKVIVAVIDTGVDLTHPDLKDSLASKGFNILTQTDDTQDAHGHGTHLSGIIAAQANSIGVRGITSNAKILPVKVIQAGPNAPIRPQSLGDSGGTALTENVAKGILYAIQNGAQVINMSLAWPSTIRSPLMKSMIELAEEKQVLVVASAGNDSTSAPVYPCAYASVICVGAHGSDGAFAHFSNFGGMVDLLAPGSAIISTWPLSKSPTVFAGGNGYEYKNGTSMSAPYVAGALAELLARGYSPQEAKARLLLGTRATQTIAQFESDTLQEYSHVSSPLDPWSNFGNLDLTQATALKPSALIVPEKTVLELGWDGVATELTASVKIKNIWKDATQIKVSANAQTFVIDSLKSNESKTLSVRIPVNTQTEDLVYIQLKIRAQNEDGSVYSHDFKLPVSITRILLESTFPKNSVVQVIPGLEVDAESNIRTVSASDGKNRSDYVILKKAGADLSAQLIQDLQIAGSITIPSRKEEELLNVYRTLQGRTVFIFADQGANKARPNIYIYFYDSKLQFEKQITVGTDTTVMPANFQWMKMSSEETLAWISVGFTPKPDLPPYDPYNKDAKDTKMSRVYFLKDGVIRTLKLKNNQLPITLLPKTNAQTLQNSVRILIAEGSGYQVRYWIYTLIDGTVQKQEQLAMQNYRMLIGNKPLVGVLNISNPDLPGDYAFAGQSMGGLRLTGNVNSSSLDFDLKRSGPLDALMITSGVFYDQGQSFAFSQTHYDLKFYVQGSDAVSATSLNRYSYIPSMIGDNTFYPTAVDSLTGPRNPAVYIPASFLTDYASEIIFADRQSAYVENGQTVIPLKRPAQFKFKLLDPSCVGVGNLMAAVSTASASQVFFCKDKRVLIPLQN